MLLDISVAFDLKLIRTRAIINLSRTNQTPLQLGVDEVLSGFRDKCLSSDVFVKLLLKV